MPTRAGEIPDRQKTNSLPEEARRVTAAGMTDAKSNQFTRKSRTPQAGYRRGQRLPRPPFQTLPLREGCPDEGQVLGVP